MVATRNDSFHLPDYEERLWDELRALHEHERVERNRQGRRPGRFRRPRGAVVLGAAVVVMVAGLVATVLLTRGDGDRTETGRVQQSTTTTIQPPLPPPAPPGPPPDASVDSIEVYEQQIGNGHTMIQVHDEETGSFRSLIQDATGDVVSESAWSGSGPSSGTYTTVVHTTRQYLEESAGFGAPSGTTEAFQHEVQSGLTVADGTEVVDGVELLRFVQPGQSLCRLAPEPEQVCEDAGAPDDHVYWVDPDASRPIGDRHGTNSGTYWYLPRTPENVALTQVSVPDGYEQVEVLGRGRNG